MQVLNLDVLPPLPTSSNKSYPAEAYLCWTLLHLAYGDSFRRLGRDHGVSHATIATAVRRTLKALLETYAHVIRLPTPDEIQTAVRYNMHKYHMPKEEGFRVWGGFLAINLPVVRPT